MVVCSLYFMPHNRISDGMTLTCLHLLQAAIKALFKDVPDEIILLLLFDYFIIIIILNTAWYFVWITLLF